MPTIAALFVVLSAFAIAFDALYITPRNHSK